MHVIILLGYNYDLIVKDVLIESYKTKVQNEPHYYDLRVSLEFNIYKEFVRFKLKINSIVYRKIIPLFAVEYFYLYFPSLFKTPSSLCHSSGKQ